MKYHGNGAEPTTQTGRRRPFSKMGQGQFGVSGPVCNARASIVSTGARDILGSVVTPEMDADIFPSICNVELVRFMLAHYGADTFSSI